MHRKKRGMQLAVAVLVLSIVFTSAIAISSVPVSAEESVFSDLIKSGESVDIDDYTFIITMDKYAKNIFVNAGDMFQSVAITNCKSMENFRICFYNVTFDEDENTLLSEIEIFRKRPEVSITKTINQTEFYVGQEALVTITIENTGDNLEKFTLTDDYPQIVEISDMEGGCGFHEGEVYLQGHMSPDTTKECTFIIKILEEMHQSLKAKLEYWDGAKWVTEYSPMTSIDVLPTLSIETAIVQEDYEVDGETFDFDDENPSIIVGEKIRFLINITNNHEEDAEIEQLTINTPTSMKYLGVASLRFNYLNASGNSVSHVLKSERIETKKYDEKITWSGKINGKDSELFIIEFKTSRSGNSNILTNIKYVIDEIDENLIMSLDYEDSIEINDPGIEIHMSIDDINKRFGVPIRLGDSDEEETNVDIESGHKYYLTVYTQNKNAFANVKNAKVNVITDVLKFEDVNYDEILAEAQKIPYSFEFVAPMVEKDTKYPINISVTYTNEYGEKNYNSTEIIFDLKAFKDIIIRIDSEEGSVLNGNVETEITVTLENTRSIDLYGVEVKDIIDSNFYVEGVHSQKLKLIADEETIVYKYRIKAPVVKNKSYFNITTQVKLFDEDTLTDYNLTSTQTFTVNVLEPEISVIAEYTEPDDIYPGSIIPITYEIENNEEKEIIRNVTIEFPIQENFDLIGPKTFTIDKIEPGEIIRLKDVIKIRPKLSEQTQVLNKIKIRYYDNYGNNFTETIGEEKFEIEKGQLSGFGIFVETELERNTVNLTDPVYVIFSVRNDGDTETEITLTLDEYAWDMTVLPGTTEKIKHEIIYDKEGNYTIPAPIIKYDYYGLDAYTIGYETQAMVLMIKSAEEIAELERQLELKEKELAQREKDNIILPPVEMTFEEWGKFAKKGLQTRAVKYVVIGAVALIILGLIVIFLYFRNNAKISMSFSNKNKKESKLESEENISEEDDDSDYSSEEDYSS